MKQQVEPGLGYQVTVHEAAGRARLGCLASQHPQDRARARVRAEVTKGCNH